MRVMSDVHDVHGGGDVTRRTNERTNERSAENNESLIGETLA